MRIINEPKRKIGNTTIAALSEIAAKENTSMLEIIRRSENYTALTRVSANLKSFSDVIDSLCRIAENESISALVKKTIEMTGYENMLIAGGEEEKERLDNVYELVSNAVDYEKNDPEASLAGFLEDIALVSDIDNYDKDADAIVLMTVHSAKGLEFPVVFLPGMENGIFPSIQSMYEKSEKEEERRLAYVALTRAKDKLYITHARERLLYGSTQYNRVSDFVEEIPKELIDEEETARRKNYFSDERRDYSFTKSYGDRFVNNQSKAESFGGPAAPSEKKEKTLEVFKVGDTVVHPKFGVGTVISAQSMSGDILYSVAFDDSVGTKRLMATTARLKKHESC
ncbi:MAG: ATP-dependent DNA helicase PcrA, partial [Clostridia bacterium]|nr:ATP-dependent DNA helicase PcrA [Clostridia bacterium]